MIVKPYESCFPSDRKLVLIHFFFFPEKNNLTGVPESPKVFLRLLVKYLL